MMSDCNNCVLQNVPKIVVLPIDSVTRSPLHTRVHNGKKQRRLEKLLGTFGQVTPIIVDEAHVIIDGDAVLSALKSLGYPKIAAMVVSNDDSADIRALRLALNRIVYDAKWDDERLRTEFLELATLGFDLDPTVFEQVEIDMVLDVDPPSPGDREEEQAREQDSEPAVVTTYDMFRAGRHELVCVAPCNQVRASVVVERPVSAALADPLYSVKIAGFVSRPGGTGNREFAIASGEIRQSEFVAILSDSLEALLPELDADTVLYLCMDWRHMAELLEAAGRHALEFRNVYVRCKTNAEAGSFHRSQHELVFVFRRGTAGHQNHFELGRHGRTRSGLRSYAGVNKLGKNRMGARPAVKPRKMITDALRDVSPERENVADPFLGSGSTLIAAEQTGRNCIGIDVDPANIEVAIRRWQKCTGRNATHVLTGLTFDELVEHRRAAAKQPGRERRTSGRSEGGLSRRFRSAPDVSECSDLLDLCNRVR